MTYTIRAFTALGGKFTLVLRGQLATFYSATGRPFGTAAWIDSTFIDPSAMHPDVVAAAGEALTAAQGRRAA